MEVVQPVGEALCIYAKLPPGAVFRGPDNLAYMKTTNSSERGGGDAVDLAGGHLRHIPNHWTVIHFKGAKIFLGEK